MAEKLSLKVEGMHCPTCSSTIEKGLSKLKGVKKVNASFVTGKVLVEFESKLLQKEKIIKEIEKLGYKVIGWRKE